MSVVGRKAPALPLILDQAVIVASTYCGVTMKMKTKMVSACGTFDPLKEEATHV